MKKIFLFLIPILSIFILVGCSEKNDNNNDKHLKTDITIIVQSTNVDST